MEPEVEEYLSLEELSKYDNSNTNLPVYLAIKGTIFDVTSNREAYPYNSGYGIFAGKDASRALAKSSLKEEDCVPEWTDLTPEQIKVLDDWHNFYKKKYPIVGQVRDIPKQKQWISFNTKNITFFFSYIRNYL
ncbi:hypothetical protein HMI56_006209 [Coelomomyces lativittatus]|nr:hypothetical protein HMI56_006209 [Coelomomyces lativittatus]